MSYNRAAIMKEAHKATRACAASSFYRGRSYAWIFAAQLRRVWADTKCRAAGAVLEASMTQADRLRRAIACLEGKDRWTDCDYASMDKLRADLRIALAHEESAPAYAEKRALIASAKGRFCSVTFTKKDGTARTMKVQPATLRQHVKGSAASKAGQKATATRAARHPNLLPVWDVEAKAPRSVNLQTVSRIAVNGTVHEYRV